MAQTFHTVLILYLIMILIFSFAVNNTGCSGQSGNFLQLVGKGWARSPNKEDVFTVCAAIGCQSSGKSTLLNCIFETSFPVGSGVGRATTKGVLAEYQGSESALFSAPLVILDVEGTESQERGHLAHAFDERVLETSTLVSDVVLVNLWAHDIGRQSLRSLLVPILRGVLAEAFLENGDQEIQKSVVFVFRDMPDKIHTESLAKIVRSEIDSTLKLSFNVPQSKLNSSSPVFHFKSFFNYKIFPEQFKQQCADFLTELLPLLDAAATKERSFGGTIPKFLSSSFEKVTCVNKDLRQGNVPADHLVFSSSLDTALKKCMQKSEERVSKLRREVDLATVTPVLNFGGRCDEILIAVCNEFDKRVGESNFPKSADKSSDTFQKLVEKRRNLLRVQIADLLEPCFLDHLSCLREYFQDIFHDQLARITSGADDFDAQAGKVKLQCLDRFENAAEGAVPESLKDLWKYELEVKWLADHIDQKVEDKKIEASLLFSTADSTPKPMPRWKRVGIQALVLGINYLQATQGLRMARRDSLRKEQKYPKFPLF